MQQKTLTPTRPKFILPVGIPLFSPRWPARPCHIKEGQPEVLPGDLSKFVLSEAEAPGWGSHTSDNLFLTEKVRVLNIKDDLTAADFAGFFRTIGIKDDDLEYALWFDESKDPEKDGYLFQARIVSAKALRRLFNAMNGYEHHKMLGRRTMSIWQAIWTFVEEERRRGTGLDGKEKLSLDFMFENSKYGVYRLRSSVRPPGY